MCDLSTDLDGVFALQDRNRVLIIVIRVGGEILGPIEGRANDRCTAKAVGIDRDARQPSRQLICDTRVNTVGARVDSNVHVNKRKGYSIVPKTHFVYNIRVGGIDPARGNRRGANGCSVRGLYLREWVIFSEGVVVAVEVHAIDRVLVVGVVIQFPYPIVAGIEGWESAEEGV